MASHAIGLKMSGDEVRMQPSTRVGSGHTALGSRVTKRVAARMRPLAGPFDCRRAAGHAPKRGTTESRERARNWYDYEELRDDRASITRQAARIPSPSATVSRHHECPPLVQVSPTCLVPQKASLTANLDRDRTNAVERGETTKDARRAAQIPTRYREAMATALPSVRKELQHETPP
jgi:hypothetical protein